MDPVRFAIQNPVKVTVAVLLLVLFGLLALGAIPIQLVPNVDQPVITVTTRWTGRDPMQIEQDIIEEQEDKLKRVSDLRKMTSVASDSQAQVTLEFHIGADMTRAELEVSDKLREVAEYPDDVDEPVITVADSASQNAIAWMVLTSEDEEYNVEELRDVVEDHVKPFLERVAGISQVNVFGGRQREVHIRIDPGRLAHHGITFSEFRQALRLDNVNVSAGMLRDDRLQWRFRTVGRYDDLEQIRATVVTETEGGPIRVRDLGDVVLTLEKRRAFVRSRARPAIALNAIHRVGSNVLQVMHGPRGLSQRVAQVNAELLSTLAPGVTLRFEQVYDETVYIYDAIELVRQNLWIGGALAVLVLLLFLRRIRPMLIIAAAIPVSVIGTFVVMTGTGRNINVVSLAGLAFAVGMVVDNAIVVLENIDRHLGTARGREPADAAYRGTREVWGAVLASTATTLAVFCPVLFMQEEAGQLFRDIAIAVMASVALSLLVAVTVIPSAAARWMRPRGPGAGGGVAVPIDGGTAASRFSRGWARMIHAATVRTAPGVLLRLGIVALFTVGSIMGAAAMMPDVSYLPTGNRNLIFGMMFTPPAYAIEHNELIAHRVERVLQPYWEALDPKHAAELDAVLDVHSGERVAVSPIENYFFVSFGGQVFMGASSTEKQNVRPLASLLTQAMRQNPGTFAFATQPSIFGRTLGSGNAAELDVVGTDIDKVRTSAAALEGVLRARFSKVRADPSNYNLPAPQMRVRIDRVRAAELHVDVAALGLGIQALIDGATIGDYEYQGRSIDLVLVARTDDVFRPDQIRTVPVAVRERSGTRRIVPLSTLATFQPDNAPQAIRRIEELRAVTLTVEPPSHMPLETVLRQVDEMVSEARQRGQIDPSVQVKRSGTADKLTQVRESLIGEWQGWTLQSLMSLVRSRMFLALLVTYLLMAALFESYLYPLVIMFSVPLATVGGFAALAIVHAYDPTQQLDIVTMLGFVILIGVVVNNAILIVHQARNFMQGIAASPGEAAGPIEPREAIRLAVQTRIRPVFMTTFTSVCGMLPLVLMPGAGSELYRGLGSVVVGGLIVSTLFTLIVVPLLLSLVIDARSVFVHSGNM